MLTFRKGKQAMNFAHIPANGGAGRRTVCWRIVGRQTFPDPVNTTQILKLHRLRPCPGLIFQRIIKAIG